ANARQPLTRDPPEDRILRLTPRSPHDRLLERDAPPCPVGARPDGEPPPQGRRPRRRLVLERAARARDATRPRLHRREPPGEDERGPPTHARGAQRSISRRAGEARGAEVDARRARRLARRERQAARRDRSLLRRDGGPAR